MNITGPNGIENAQLREDTKAEATFVVHENQWAAIYTPERPTILIERDHANQRVYASVIGVRL